jgi:hypothetical protein
LPVVEVVAVALDHVVKHRDERLAAAGQREQRREVERSGAVRIADELDSRSISTATSAVSGTARDPRAAARAAGG